MQTLVHRGPDDSDMWMDRETGVALAHRRLSIVDLSETGRQPMVSHCGRFVMTYNGEIYNFRELRRELAQLGHQFRGHSDSEVLLAALSEWGIEKALGRLNGMFAIALWDRTQRSLTLVRDRVGTKPLYYGWHGKTFLFGSELKALRVHPDFEPEIDRDALGLFVQYSWVPSPYSIYKNVHKLPPGTFLTVTAAGTADTSSRRCYWHGPCRRGAGIAFARERFARRCDGATRRGAARGVVRLGGP